MRESERENVRQPQEAIPDTSIVRKEKYLLNSLLMTVLYYRGSERANLYYERWLQHTNASLKNARLTLMGSSPTLHHTLDVLLVLS